VRVAHVLAAQAIMDSSIASVRKLADEASGKETLTPQEEVARVGEWFKSQRIAKTRRDAMRGCRFIASAKSAQAAVDTLVERGELDEIKTTQDGKTKTAYRWKT
jgi:hypothetical protein